MMWGILKFWYIDSFFVMKERWLWLLFYGESRLAVTKTIHMLKEPLFQDYSWQGRALGVVFRLLRALFGILLYALSFLVIAAAYFMWMLLPFLGIVAIIGSVVGNQPTVWPGPNNLF